MNICNRLILTSIVPMVIVSGPVAMATEKISEQEGIECQLCHADLEQRAETLTDQGLYYQYLETLEGYDQVVEQFENCTYCHAEQAGAKTLTGEGYRLRWMMQDMAGLRAWLDEYHPRPDQEDETAGESD